MLKKLFILAAVGSAMSAFGAEPAAKPAGPAKPLSHELTSAEFEQLLPELRRVLAQVQHGSVTLIVQDGRVVQIDATHKLRLSRRDGTTPPIGRGQ